MDANSTEPGHHEFRDADGKWWSDSEKNKCELARQGYEVFLLHLWPNELLMVIAI